MNDKYVKNLENTIKQFLEPIKDIPFKLVIESLSGYEIKPFNENRQVDKTILDNLIIVAKNAGGKINSDGIERKRANEVGNDIESYVKKELNEIGYDAGIPDTSKGKKKATGYPDLQFLDHKDRFNYLECKTYNKDNIDTSQRSFYLSPSKEFKVTSDTHHFAISYEVYVKESMGSKNVYKVKGWKILSLENLSVDVKHEFNSDNIRLYSNDNILAEGSSFK